MSDPDDHLDDCIPLHEEFEQEDGPEPGEECGRWNNGRLTVQCMKFGTEECDFECPYRSGLT